ncbi:MULTISPECIES: pyocin activator PrtN family protein [unclassified Pseudomonas]|uniref:pyocin activator PrtN family protein n=1 Tax=unclassified Pseudomonas TaxID=196821 RepID=UPI0009198400|nr:MULTISPECIES: pyocin activator PrtN family protein [unclassified Pseudomonas]SFX98317.1 Pyocin activator protein PrtN [Pseudomonas sp. NFPP16]SFY23103.1 Pyocin activator protein PrtN [Pseudomonas sp. NFPP14]
MNTLFLLMAQYQGQAVIPIGQVCTDYMGLTIEKFKLKCSSGEIDIPIVRLGAESQKAALGVHLVDLANYIDQQRTKAKSDHEKLMGR